MRGYLAFLSKEFLEQLRTYKLLILPVVFLIFGMMSPVLAKMMPEIFASIDMEGMEIVIPEPTYLDSYAQFFKNSTQMGIIAVLLVFSGMMSQEFSRGTLIGVLAKGLPRPAVLFSKYTAAMSLWSGSLALSAAAQVGYTLYLFGSHDTTGLLFSLFCMWLFGAFLIAASLCMGTLLKGGYAGLLATVAILGGLMIAGTWPVISEKSPMLLLSVGPGLMQGLTEVQDYAWAAWITGAALVAFLAGAVWAFKKKEL